MSNVIRYQFRGELDVDLLAKNMKRDKTPIVIVIRTGNADDVIFILKSFSHNYKGADIKLTGNTFKHICKKAITCHRDILGEHSPLLRWESYSARTSDIIKNIKAIIKSHEDACLPTVKVIAVETADWSGK